MIPALQKSSAVTIIESLLHLNILEGYRTSGNISYIRALIQALCESKCMGLYVIQIPQSMQPSYVIQIPECAALTVPRNLIFIPPQAYFGAGNHSTVIPFLQFI